MTTEAMNEVEQAAVQSAIYGKQAPDGWYELKVNGFVPNQEGEVLHTSQKGGKYLKVTLDALDPSGNEIASFGTVIMTPFLTADSQVNGSYPSYLKLCGEWLHAFFPEEFPEKPRTSKKTKSLWIPNIPEDYTGTKTAYIEQYIARLRDKVTELEADPSLAEGARFFGQVKCGKYTNVNNVTPEMPENVEIVESV